MKLLLHFCLLALVAMGTCSFNTNETRLFDKGLFKMSDAGTVLSKRDSIPGASLDVKLTPLGNATMQAVVTNNGTVDLNLLHIGSLLDPALPVTKVALFSDNSSIPSGGMRVDAGSSPMDFTAESFTTLMVGQSITVDIDAATTYDLSAGGAFTAMASGQFRYTDANSTVVRRSPLLYRSNAIDMTIEALAATGLERRATINDGCAQWQRDYIEMSARVCAGFTRAAISNMHRGLSQDRFEEYFKKPRANGRNRVFTTLQKLHAECLKIPNDGPVEIFCKDLEDKCYREVQAYEVLGRPDQTVICPIGWDLH